MDFDVATAGSADMNVSDYLEEPSTKIKYITAGVLIGIISLFGIVTNFILIMVEIRNRRSLTSSIDIFVLNLSIADLIYLAIDSPVSVYAHIKTNQIFPWAFLCKVNMGIIVSLLFVRIYTFIPMLINHMKSKKKYKGINSTRLPGSKLLVRASIGFLWVFAVIQAIPISIRTQVYSPDINNKYYSCFAHQMDRSLIAFLMDLFSVIIMEILPLVILMVLVTALIIDINNTTQRDDIHLEGSKFLTIAIISQIVLHMPFSIVMIINQLQLGFQIYNAYLLITINLLRLSGHSINPVIFYYLWSDFRNAVHKKSRNSRNSSNVADNDQSGIYPVLPTD